MYSAFDDIRHQARVVRKVGGVVPDVVKPILGWGRLDKAWKRVLCNESSDRWIVVSRAQVIQPDGRVERFSGEPVFVLRAQGILERTLDFAGARAMLATNDSAERPSLLLGHQS